MVDYIRILIRTLRGGLLTYFRTVCDHKRSLGRFPKESVGGHPEEGSWSRRAGMVLVNKRIVLLAGLSIDAPETALLTTICSVNIHQHAPIVSNVLMSRVASKLAEHIRTCQHIEVIPPTDSGLLCCSLVGTMQPEAPAGIISAYWMVLLVDQPTPPSPVFLLATFPVIPCALGV